MRKAFVIGEALMFGSLLPLFVLPEHLNVWVWTTCMVSGTLVHAEVWKHWRNRKSKINGVQ